MKYKCVFMCVYGVCKTACECINTALGQHCKGILWSLLANMMGFGRHEKGLLPRSKAACRVPEPVIREDGAAGRRLPSS